MAKTIFKYPLLAADRQVIAMPEGAELLCVDSQHGRPCLWAIVDPDFPSESRPIEIRGTGHLLGDVGAYVGTFFLEDGDLVFHVFDGVKRKKHGLN